MYFRNVFLCVNTKTRPSPIQPAAVQTDTNVRQSERAEQELSARRRAQHNAILEIGKQKSLLNSQRMPLSISRDKIKTTLTSDNEVPIWAEFLAISGTYSLIRRLKSWKRGTYQCRHVKKSLEQLKRKIIPLKGISTLFLRYLFTI